MTPRDISHTGINDKGHGDRYSPDSCGQEKRQVVDEQRLVDASLCGAHGISDVGPKVYRRLALSDDVTLQQQHGLTTPHHRPYTWTADELGRTLSGDYVWTSNSERARD